MDNASIKENISLLRKKKSISQEEMASRIGVGRNAYRSLEKGKTQLLNSHIDEIANVLGVSTEEIVLGYNPEKGKSNTQLNDTVLMYESRMENLKAELFERIENLEAKIRTLENENALLKGRIADKEIIISLLKNRKG